MNVDSVSVFMMKRAKQQSVRHHTEMHLKVIDCIDVNVDTNDLFPEKSLLKNDQGDDHLAEYKLSRQGCIADFYQSEEQWNQS